MNAYQTFYFEDFSFDPQTGEVKLRYSLDEEVYFEEVWQFALSHLPPTSPQIQSALQGLWIMCGISYYKAYLPKNLVIKGDHLTQSQAEFFEKIYVNGLGEFFYTNQIDPNGLIQFPYEEVTKSRNDETMELEGTLIPVGGGKDSLTTIEILKETKADLTTWAVGHAEIFKPMLETIDLPHLQVQRKICPNLIAENKKGALNGHVPISAILAFASVVTALLNGKKYIALSNEASANQANVEMYGMAINHQYSKTLEFEQDFQAYVAENISDQVQYFSFLRPLKEIQIAQIFCSKCFKKYRGNFSSCNKNFTISKNKTEIPDQVRNDKKMRWCGQCPKCAFVACIFAPFLSREQMHDLFGCEIFQQGEIIAFIPELLGQTEHKPFECVGEYDEVQYAINQAIESGNWPELEPFRGENSRDLKKLSLHSMPSQFFVALENFLSQNLDK